MASDNPTLAAFYEGWSLYQGHLITALTPLTADQLLLRAAPTLRTVGTIATHIVAVRARWFHLAAGEGGTEFDEIGSWDHDGQPVRTAAELVSGLETTWQLIQSSLERWTPADLETPFQVNRGGHYRTLTKQWIVWHVIEHDLHHGGELSFSLGMYGIAGIDL